MNEPQQKELNLDESFNLIVNLARQAKLSYDEHALVDKAINKILAELNKKSGKKEEKKEEKKD